MLDEKLKKNIRAAADVLLQGGVVAFPTETVYGLGADAANPLALRRVFEIKGRPSDHPLIVHVAETAHARDFASNWPAVAQRLVDAFWPGPLTVIVERAQGMAGAAAAGQTSIGLRCPAHPVANALLRAARRLGVTGVAAPSANRFGRISPTRASHVIEEFGDGMLVLDGGACRVGIESSIVDCSRGRPVLLRPGLLTRAQLEDAAGEPLLEPDADAPRAPGTLVAHYAPNAKLRLMSGPMLKAALELLESSPVRLAVYSRSLPAGIGRGVVHRRMASRPDAAAHELFQVLRDLDAQGVQLIWVEEPPSTPDWDGVRDRLQRAAAA